VKIPFLYDIAAHVRFLVTIPVLVLAEIPIGFRIRQAATHFLTAGLVREEDHARFAQIVEDALRLRDSRLAGLIVLGAAYAATFGVLMTALHGGSTWYAPDPHGRMTPVGYWYALVALPIFQFLMYRWIYRMAAWARFLHQVSQLDLRLMPTHPDGAGGLAFLGKGTIPFGVILFGLSAVVSSEIGMRVVLLGAKLEDFQVAYAALFVLTLLIFAGPLLVFLPRLTLLKQRGLLEYGALASHYTQLFEAKWIKGTEAGPEGLLGTADIQSLADLGNSYELVRKMRSVPIELSDFIAMAIPGVIPALPLVATVMPVGVIVKDLLHLIA
jgi:hypothetical protein